MYCLGIKTENILRIYQGFKPIESGFYFNWFHKKFYGPKNSNKTTIHYFREQKNRILPDLFFCFLT